jgi:lysophospholipase L1-like esterase
MRFLLAGDSTVAACPPEEHPMSGWGAALEGRLRPEDEVFNFAKGGATTESFIAEGLWNNLLAQAHPGDVALIQFGHNDQKQPGLLAAEGGYRDRLERFVRELRDLGIAPVLCTSVERRLFSDGRLRPSHGSYPRAVRGLAVALDVPLVDLTTFTSWLYEDLGAEGSATLFTDLDDTHFHEHGAELVAAFVARSLRAILGWDDELVPLGRPS